MPYAWSSAHSENLDERRDRTVVDESIGLFVVLHAGSTYGEGGLVLDDVSRLLPALLGQRRRDGHELDGGDLATVLDEVRRHVLERLRDDDLLAAVHVEIAALLWPEMSSELWLGHVGSARAVRVHDGKGEALFAPDTLIEEQIAAGVVKRHETARIVGPRGIVIRAWSLHGHAPARLTPCAVALEDIIALVSGNLHDDPDLGPWIVGDCVRDAGPGRAAQALVAGGPGRGLVLVVQQVP